MNEIEIPDAAMDVLVARGYNAFPDEPDESVRRDLRLIAAPIVAAELRRSADSLQNQRPTRPRTTADMRGMDFGMVVAIKALRARADELDGGA